MKEEIAMLRLLIDTDPGIDDALALFLAMAAPDVQIEAITTVSGNVPVDVTTQNALSLLELAGRSDIPVARGCEHPLIREPEFAEHVHGNNGLGGVTLPEPTHSPVDGHAVNTIIEKILAAPGETTLVTLGPLTNVALAARIEPRIVPLVREVVMMGGALRVPGNVTPSAEFNIFVDPHAAQIVLHAGWPVRIVSLDVTHQTSMSREQFAAIGASGHPVPQAIERMVAFYFDEFGKSQEEHDFYMHDPLCVAVALQPDLITWKPALVDVELNSPLTLGATVAQFEQTEHATLTQQQRSNVLMPTSVDAGRFAELYMRLITSAYKAV